MSPKPKFSRKSMLVGGVVAVATLVGVGVVAALWTASGSGSGRATAGVAAVATITPVDGEPDLYPGSTDGDLYFAVENPNPYAVTFTALEIGAVTSADPAACPEDNITIVPAAGLSLAVPAGSTADLSVPDVVSMSVDAPDGCQGMAFDVAITLTGAQS